MPQCNSSSERENSCIVYEVSIYLSFITYIPFPEIFICWHLLISELDWCFSLFLIFDPFVCNNETFWWTRLRHLHSLGFKNEHILFGCLQGPPLFKRLSKGTPYYYKWKSCCSGLDGPWCHNTLSLMHPCDSEFVYWVNVGLRGWLQSVANSQFLSVMRCLHDRSSGVIT